MAGTSLYRFFDSTDRLLYVGITSAGPGRWIDHEQHREWWRQVARTTVEHFPDRTAASEAERAAVLEEQPIYNIRLTQKRPPKPLPVYRRHGQGSITEVYDSPNRRWAAVTPWPVRRYYRFAQREQAEMFLRAYTACVDPDIRKALTRALGRASQLMDAA